jgi:hypothetical protein
MEEWQPGQLEKKKRRKVEPLFDKTRHLEAAVDNSGSLLGVFLLGHSQHSWG